jgi:hypothetical protein
MAGWGARMISYAPAAPGPESGAVDSVYARKDNMIRNEETLNILPGSLARFVRAPNMLKAARA